MANHLRRQIREAVATTVTGLTTTSTRVFQSRVYPLELADLPALLVRTESETSEPSTIHGPRLLMRLLTVTVAGVAQANADIDDTLDGICKEVEIALASDLTLGGKCKTVTLTGTEIELQGSSESPVGKATLTYAVEYWTAENAPDVAQ